jgi:tRNA wybutosine-synthesizing protein 2
MKARTCQVCNIRTSISEPWVDQTRKPYIFGDIAYLPVLEGYPYTVILPERERKGRGFQRIGEFIAFHGERPGLSLIEEVISAHHPKGVIWYKSHIGCLRIPDFEILWGEIGEVRLKESGIIYMFDPVSVMFSQGNRQEKERVSSQVKPGEYCCDMFAGIGYFSLPLARAGANVHAIELNPSAVEYLYKNSKLNGLDCRISISSGDCRDQMKGTYDRIHMGHYEAISFLDSALKYIHTGTILHLHSIGDISREIFKVLENTRHIAEMSSHLIKTVGPNKRHMVFDLVIKS